MYVAADIEKKNNVSTFIYLFTAVVNTFKFITLSIHLN